MSDMKPGFRCDIFLLADKEWEKSRPHRSLIYESDTAAGRLVIAQPSPPLPPRCAGQEIFLTYLSRRGVRSARFGFRARILSLLDKYTLASHQQVPAVLIQQVARSCPFDVRQRFRIKPVPADLVTLSLGGERLRVIDLSLGGAVINGGKVQGLRLQDRIDLSLAVDGRQYHLDAEVVRVWSGTGWEPGVIAPFLAAVKFLSLPPACENALGKKILFWERKRLAQEVPQR